MAKSLLFCCCCLLSPAATRAFAPPAAFRLSNSHHADANVQTTSISAVSIPDDAISRNQNERADEYRRLRRDVLARRRRAVTEQEDEARGRQDVSFLALALVPCILAFVSWEELSLSIAKLVDDPNGLLRPTITGIVIPVTSIAFATLLSTTVSVLRQRQVDLRALLNKEACDLRFLRRTIFGMFGTRQHAGRRAKALTLLTDYVDQLNRECHSGGIVYLEEMELSGGIAENELDQLNAMLHGVDGAAASRQGSAQAADDIISRLNGYRSDRVALLLTDFPDLHWLVLIGLSVSLCVTFLLESNQIANQYLNSFQLRALFTSLVGVFAATAELCSDLDDPFTGTFSIVSASTQIGDLVLNLREDARDANAEAVEISSAKRKSLKFFNSLMLGPSEGGTGSQNTAMPKKTLSSIGTSRNNDLTNRNAPSTPPRYGLLSTIYFHLLTGPLGSNVRALGDVAAWLTTVLVRRMRTIIAWKIWPWKRKNKSNN